MPAPSTASGVSSSSWAGPMSSSPLQHCGHRSHFGSMYTLGSCCKAGLLYFSMSQTSKTHSFHLDNHLLCLVPKLVTTRCSAPVAAFFELKRMKLRWRSQPWAHFFLELSAIQGFWRAFFEISSGSSSFIKTNCQDWMAFHLSKAVVGKKMKKVLVRIGCIQFFCKN